MKFPTFRHPRALALAARNRPLKPSSLALVCKECQRSRICGNCLSRRTNVPRTGANSRQSAAYSATCLPGLKFSDVIDGPGEELDDMEPVCCHRGRPELLFNRGKERRRHVTDHLDDVFRTAFMGSRERAEPGQAFPCPCRESRGPRACRDGPGR